MCMSMCNKFFKVFARYQNVFRLKFQSELQSVMSTYEDFQMTFLRTNSTTIVLLIQVKDIKNGLSSEREKYLTVIFWKDPLLSFNPHSFPLEDNFTFSWHRLSENRLAWREPRRSLLYVLFPSGGSVWGSGSGPGNLEGERMTDNWWWSRRRFLC